MTFRLLNMQQSADVGYFFSEMFENSFLDIQPPVKWKNTADVECSITFFHFQDETDNSGCKNIHLATSLYGCICVVNLKNMCDYDA